MHSCPSKHGIHKISSLSGNYGNNLHVRLTLDFLVIFSYGSHGIGDVDGGQASAFIESIVPYGSHGIGDVDGGQTAAILESIISYGSHGIGDVDGGQASAIIESIVPYGSHGIGDYSVIASCNQCIGICLYDGITVIPGIILCISTLNFNGCQAAAAFESIVSDGCYGGNYNSLEIISLPCFE